MNDYKSVEQATDLLLKQIGALNEHEDVPLLDALGRVSFSSITATIDQPPFDRSPLDGYAMNHMDIQDAGNSNPVKLHIKQTIYAGNAPSEKLLSGEAVRLMTGAPIPEGATCVIRQEDTVAQGDTVTIFTPMGKFENYCFRGEDTKRGTVLVEGGERLTVAHIGILAGHGFESIRVHRRPRVCVLSTGSELLQPGTPLKPGKIYDSNRMTLYARAKETGAEIVSVNCVEDNPECIAETIQNSLKSCDILITTGGVSVGAKDYMPMVSEIIDGEILFRGINVKPGGPAFAMNKDEKTIICLSGNPFAAFATFELLAVPAIRKLAGFNNVLHKRISGVMQTDYSKESHGRRFVRARIEGQNIYIPKAGHASGMLHSLAGCNCLIDIPAGNSGLKIGDTAEVLLF